MNLLLSCLCLFDLLLVGAFLTGSKLEPAPDHGIIAKLKHAATRPVGRMYLLGYSMLMCCFACGLPIRSVPKQKHDWPLFITIPLILGVTTASVLLGLSIFYLFVKVLKHWGWTLHQLSQPRSKPR